MGYELPLTNCSLAYLGPRCPYRARFAETIAVLKGSVEDEQGIDKRQILTRQRKFVNKILTFHPKSSATVSPVTLSRAKGLKLCQDARNYIRPEMRTRICAGKRSIATLRRWGDATYCTCQSGGDAKPAPSPSVSGTFPRHIPEACAGMVGGNEAPHSPP